MRTLRKIGPSNNTSVSRTPLAFPRGTTKTAQGYWIFIHQCKTLGETRRAPKIAPPEEEETDKLHVVEAVLFLSKEGVTSRKLAKLAGLADATEARTLIRLLNENYDQRGSSFRVEEVAGGYTLLTRSCFADWIRRLQHTPDQNRLSQSSLETLAIVAYRQPVLRAEVEAIRGVGSSEALRQLMELDLVRISGRSEELGRPYLYGTTRKFLQMFGLRSADRLPRREWVNEVQLSLTSSESQSSDSDAKESVVAASLATEEFLSEEDTEQKVLPGQAELEASSTAVAVDEDEDDFYEDDDDEEEDYEDEEEDDGFDSWEDDGETDDDEDDTDDDDDEEDDDEEQEWEEVDDDDDGWDDDDDDEEEDDADSDSGWETEDDDDDDDWGDDEDNWE